MRRIIYLIIIAVLLSLLLLGVWFSQKETVQINDANSLPKEKSFEEILKKARSGDAEAQIKLGKMYLEHKIRDKSIPDDYKEAIKWFTKPAEQGNANAQNLLGVMYGEGWGVEQDYKQAAKWFTKAAEQGDANAQYNIGLMYRERKIGSKNMWQDFQEAVRWFTKAAEQGNANAQCHLGVMYVDDLVKGAEKDYKQAFKWFTMAAEQGNAYAQFNLGLMYYEGKGVVEDYKKAFEWLIKAAEQGNANAQCKLGYLYASGKEVIKDNVEAYKWFLLAGMNGLDVSKIKETLKNEMTLEQISLSQQRAKKFAEIGGNDKTKDIEGALAGLTVTGTGFFISQEGYLMTAAHIVNNAAAIKVIWQGKEIPATLIFIDKDLVNFRTF